MLVRNDDCCFGTTLHEIQTFCEICDRYGVTPIHAITPIGNVRRIDCKWDNALIRQMSGTALFIDNKSVVEYLQSRKHDRFAVHGLWHTHRPNLSEISAAKTLTPFHCSYYVPPFNETDEFTSGEYVSCTDGNWKVMMRVLGTGLPRIEDYLEAGDPKAEIMYTHSWRFEHGPFTWPQLDKCLARLTARS